MERIASLFPVGPRAKTGLAVLGGLTAAYGSVQALRFVWLQLLRPSALPRYQHAAPSSPGPAYALITGASDGIGKAFAEELCQRGFNVILHGRNAEKLARVQAELRQQWPRADIQLAVQEAYPCSEPELEALLAPLRTLHITVLINNLGGAPPGPLLAPQEEIGAAAIDAWIGINVRFPTQLTARLLPQLRASAPALIVNVSSFAGLLGMPYGALYSAAKAWTAVWSSTLAAEMQAEGHDVEVLGLWVGEVRTGHSHATEDGFTRPAPRPFVRSVLHKVGCGHAMVTPHLGHALQAALMSFMPQAIVTNQLIGIAKGLRQSARDEGGAAKKSA